MTIDSETDQSGANDAINKQRLLGIAMLTGFVVIGGFAIGFPKGYFGEQGSVHAGFVVGGKTTLFFFVVLALVFLTATMLNWLKVPAHFRNVAMIVLAMGGIWAAQTIIDSQPERFFKEFTSGAGLGLLVGLGSYWAGKKGWTPRRRSGPQRR